MAEADTRSREERIAYGGQAVMEGVMMRSRRRMAVAVRHPAGHIVVKTEDIVPGRVVRVLRRVPVLRGVAVLWDVLALGMRTLAFSANVSLEDVPGAASSGADGPDASGASSSETKVQADDPPERVSEETSEGGEGGGGAVWGMLAFGMIFGIALFFVLPLLLTSFTDSLVESDFLSNLIEGLIRLGIFIAYLYLIGRLADIRRTFQYHGAEHMTVNALERGQELTVDNVMGNSLSHPRCGTNFLLVIVVMSVFVFAFLGRPDLLLRLGSRIVLIPLIAGVAFEIIKLLSTNLENPLARLLLKPGLSLQRLTTRMPTPDQVEVAITAMGEVLKTEEEHDLISPSLQPVLEYRT